MASLNRRTYGGEGGDKMTAESAFCTEVYRLEDDDDSPDAPTAADVRATVQYFLGDTAFESFDGQIQRTLPLAHPVYPNLVADSVNIAPVQGDDFVAEVTDPDDVLEAQPPAKRIIWHSYEFTVNFAPVPYAMVRDERILKTESAWYDFSGVLQPFFYVNEWVRYTDLEVRPREEFIKAKQGQMKFRTAANKPNAPYPGVSSMPLPNDSIMLTWYRVPYRYVKSANSYLRRYRFCVNQFAWEGFDAGELLYKGFTVRRYSPPIVGLDEKWDVGVTSTEKLCDITIEFIATDRAATDPPATTDPPYSDTNRNWVMNGFNLAPYWRNRKYYYVSMVAKPPDFPDEVPMFRSFPVEILFTDPDVVQDGI